MSDAWGVDDVVRERWVLESSSHEEYYHPKPLAMEVCELLINNRIAAQTYEHYYDSLRLIIVAPRKP